MKETYRLKYCERLIERGMPTKEIISLLKTRSSRNKNYWIERGYENHEAEKMAMSRCPGTIEYYTIYKNKSLDESKILSEEYRKNKAHTKENYIKKYGSSLGIKKWESYCEKHRIKNGFKYKNEKFGWSKEQFNEYNKSRAVTLENLISRHGENKGRMIWKSYRDKQSYTKSQKYVVEKYGIDEWKRLCKVKLHTYETYLYRYNGDVELATEKFNEYCKSFSNRIAKSKIADDLFSNIVNRLLNSNYKRYYCGIHNQEWFINIKNYGIIFLDFFLKDTGKVIEFFGDYWHANPKKYKKGTIINLRTGGIKKVEDVWENDKIRLDHIKRIPYIKDILIIWEYDYRKDPSGIIEKCMEYLTK